MPVQATCDARDEGLDIFVLARTDSLMLGWDAPLFSDRDGYGCVALRGSEVSFNLIYRLLF